MTKKKVLGWLVVIFLVFWLVTNPAGSADAVRGVGNALITFFHSVAEFFGRLFSHVSAA
jgi:hypothetical protein